MASNEKRIQQVARQLFKASIVDGAVSPDRVRGVIEYVEKHHPADALTILRGYQRLVAAEVARGQARIEHAGPMSESALAAIAAAMSKRYGRPIAASGRRNDDLLAGVRVRVGDDVYESSVAGQLNTLSSSV